MICRLAKSLLENGDQHQQSVSKRSGRKLLRQQLVAVYVIAPCFKNLLLQKSFNFPQISLFRLNFSISQDVMFREVRRPKGDPKVLAAQSTEQYLKVYSNFHLLYVITQSNDLCGSLLYFLFFLFFPLTIHRVCFGAVEKKIAAAHLRHWRYWCDISIRFLFSWNCSKVDTFAFVLSSTYLFSKFQQKMTGFWKLVQLKVNVIFSSCTAMVLACLVLWRICACLETVWIPYKQKDLEG